MAIKNLQTQVHCVAVQGVVATGMRKETMRADGNFQAPFLSLPSLLPLAGPYSFGMCPDNQGVLRAGRSACGLGVVPSVRASASYGRERKSVTWPMTNQTRG